MAIVDCPFCYRNTVQCLATRKDAKKVYHCNSCDLLFLHPFPTVEEIKQFYKDGYFDGCSGSDYQNYIQSQLKLISDRKSFWHRRLDQIETFVEQPGKILDIGCAHGFFLKATKDRGWNPYGVELSQEAASYVRRNYDFDVFLGDLKLARYPDEFFDVITMWDLLEHIVEIDPYIGEVTRILKKNGIIALATPNAALGKVLRDRWYGFHTSFEHVYFFSPKFLKNFFYIKGYETLLGKTELLPSYGASSVPNSIGEVGAYLRSLTLLRKILRPVKRIVSTISGKFYAGGILIMYFRKK